MIYNLKFYIPKEIPFKNWESPYDQRYFWMCGRYSGKYTYFTPRNRLRLIL